MNIFHKLREMKILLIDDDEWIRDSLCIFFEAEGCHILAIGSAEEGLEVLARQSYDIIICDYKLPGLDGLTLLKEAQKSHPEASKILITAYMNEGLKSAAKKIGIEDFVAKPFNSETLEASLAHLIEKREGLANF